jgi:hypothetical protein
MFCALHTMRLRERLMETQSAGMVRFPAGTRHRLVPRASLAAVRDDPDAV